MNTNGFTRVQKNCFFDSSTAKQSSFFEFAALLETATSSQFYLKVTLVADMVLYIELFRCALINMIRKTKQIQLGKKEYTGQ